MLPYDLTQWATFLALSAALFVIIALRYFLVLGSFHLILNRLFFDFSAKRKINNTVIEGKQYQSELFWSALSSLVFALIGALTFLLWQQGYIAIYTDFQQYAWWWFPVGIIAAIFLHETYYYWLHRWMHRPKVFQHVHRVHHESKATSLWTSFSFHPTETLLQAIAVPLILYVVPLHYVAVLVWLVFMTLTSAINHCNIEIYPKNFHRHWLGQWLIGATHHSRHHTQYRFNFGLYFTFWDRLMKTENDDYAEQFESLTS